MCEDEYKNPAATEFPEGFNNWQFILIRAALRRYVKYKGKGNLSDNQVAHAISVYTGVEMGKDVINRFLSGYYGKDVAGNWIQPTLKYLQAIVSFLLNNEIYELEQQDLKEDDDDRKLKKLKWKDLLTRRDSYDIPLKWSQFLQLDIQAEAHVQYDECSAIYFGSVSTERITKSITLYVDIPPPNGELFRVREYINGTSKKNNENLDVAGFGNSSEIKYDGWGFIMPEGYVLFLMKERIHGYNQLIITSNEFDFYFTQTVPQEFFAVTRDEKINHQKPRANSGNAGFSEMFGKTLTFKKQN